jgi:ParG
MKVTFDLDDAIPETRVFNAPEGYRRLTINLKEDLHKKIKLQAVQDDTTVTDIITDLLDDYFGTTLKDIEEQANKLFEAEVKKYSKPPVKRGRPSKLSQIKGKR